MNHEPVTATSETHSRSSGVLRLSVGGLGHYSKVVEVLK